MSRIAAIATALLAFSQGSPGHAQQTTAAQVVAFIDTDHDGKISLQEYLELQAGRFSQVDSDKSGELDLAEFTASLPEKNRRTANGVFKIFALGHPTLDRERFLRYHQTVFKNYLDLNHDGFVTLEEWTKVVGD